MTRITQFGLAALLSLAATSAFANITGTVFRDYDADGVIDTGEPGLGGITVTAYNAAGTSVATATTFDQSCSAAATPVAACTGANTPALGSYTLVIASGGPFRVEFTGETGSFATAAFGSANPTSVQFIPTSTATANAGFNNPAQYCAGPTPPAVVAGFFAFGNQTPGLTTLFGFDYDARGIDHDADPATAGVQPQRSYGLSDQTGAVYGIAYQRRTRSLFSATYLHRGSPLGSTANTGTIYISSNVARGTTNINAAPFITVNGLAGIDTGVDTHPAGTDWNLDAATYGVVGKRGLGDLEISEDGLTLYTINLFQREVLVLPIGTGPTAPTAAQIVRVPVPVPASCSGAVPSAAAPSVDDIRPFATKFFDGTLYVGMICTAQTMRAAGGTLAAAKNAMRGYVYAMNPATNTFAATPILEFPLNYPRRYLNNGIGAATTDGEWNPWNDTFQPTDAPGSANFWIYPQPVFTDLEFDAQGRMAIGLRDRLSDQAYDSDDIGPLGNQNDSTRQGGDLLLACRNGTGGSWVLENAGACGTSTTSDPNSTGAGTNVNSGPGNREFYWEEYYDFDFAPDFHRETAMGSLLWRPGSGNFMSTVYDVDGTFNSGVRVYRNDNGANALFPGNVRHEFRLYEDGTSTFGKAGGIGDIEILCEDPPVELGNRIWRDSNNNGRQDPGEPPIAGVVVNLYSAAGAQLGTATTDATGHFLFLFSVGATDPSTADNTIIQPNPYGTGVTVLVAPSNFNAGGPLAGFTRTLANTGGVIRDSNGVATTVAGGGPSGTGFTATVGQPGRNDHTIDFGFGIADFGDLPDGGVGIGAGNYQTLAADTGASHGIVPGLLMGTTVDGEADGQPNVAASGDDTAGAPDDEDGVTVADLNLRVATAPTVRVNATNTTGAAAQLCGFIDFNGDGDFLDAGESATAVAVPNGSNNVQFNLVFGTVPAGSAAASYARFRLSDTIAACSAVGAVGNGEVEDYPVGIAALDFGDLPDAAAGTGVGNYNTQEADTGARHPIVAGLFLGASVDAEADGQQNVAASGDDVAGVPDDEDGVTTADLQFVTGSAATVRVNATNLGATAATLCGFVDFNGDGDFGDANEAAPGLTVAAGTNNVQFTLNFGTAPVGAASTYARFRLATPTGACTPNGLGGNGEVEDYPAGVIPADLGDLPDTTAGIGAANYSTLIANNGPRHPRTATAPRLGATVDTEADGQPNLAATGDGADEDGVTIGALLVGANATIGVNASNPGAGVAQVCGFLDFNGDGDFNDAGETAPPVNVAAGTVSGSFSLNFGIVPVGTAASTYARFRISSGIAACTPDGLAVDGEVEDYAVAIGTLDLGDLPDPTYPTLIASNGARHPIVTGLRIGATVDAEANGQPNAGATGDDANGTPDDEDGVTIADLSLVGGTAANVRVNATNTTGTAAQLCGFVDFNGDGDLNDAGETAPAVAVANGSNNVQFTLNFGVVPAGFSGSTYARFRLSTDAGACAPTGLATNGEVEDYTASIALVDFGDLPDTAAGSGTGNYSTLLADNGPRHPIVAGLRLGANEDGEGDGQPNTGANGDDVNGVPDDEDGVTVADLSLTGGSPANVRVTATNTSGSAAQLCGFIDFNGDGDFADAGETAPALAVANGSNNVQFTLAFGTVPTTAVASTYARFRLSTDIAACSAVGAATNGEVEDYPVGIAQFDFGDLPDTGVGIGANNYATLLADNGPRHPIVAGLRLGAEEDAEADGQPNAGADADDTTGTPDDEDGVTVTDLSLVAGSSASVRVNATNTTGSAAQLCGFIDFNGDGDFADGNETAPALAVPNGSNNTQFTLNFGTVPTSVATGTYARFRLSTDAGACSPTGAATNGEVEDYAVSIGLLDYGDLPDTAAGSGTGNYSTLLADNGPRHPIVAGLRIGANEDGEADGQPSTGANGDDGSGVPDDEDGVVVGDLSLVGGSPANVRVNATNTTGAAAQLCGFIDFNGDGDFNDASETAPALAVATGSNNVQFTLAFGTVPGTAVTSTYARFRLSTDTGTCSAVGAAPDGEVEDNPISISQTDFGDLPDTGVGLGANNYATLLADNGPRHPIVAGLHLGANEDGEADGQPSAAANGDDAAGTPDDEDGINTADLALTAGTPANVRVTATNTLAGAAQLCGFIDFNADGDFADAGETAPAVSVPAGSNGAPFTLAFGTVPTGVATSSFARFRLSTDAGACSPTGAATDGEVEDYPVSAGLLDFGDLPDAAAGTGVGNYATLLADDGPRHPIVAGLRLGAEEDGEAEGQPSTAADGDDAAGVPDDEDGVTIADLTLTGGATANVRVTATNTGATAARICGFIDFNGDGDFADAGESAPAVAVAAGSNNVQFSVAFGTVPTSAVSSTYARFRLSTDAAACTATGIAANGEVEDYAVSIGQVDYGDLPDTAAGSGVGNYATLLSDNGPRHPIVSGLRLGTNEDGDADGQPGVGADGDDTNGTPDDEDGVTLADLALVGGTPANVRVNATNTTGTAAQLCGFIDFNGDGDFADAGETAAAASVPTGSNDVQFTLNFGTVPVGAAASSYARFRLSTDTTACSATGAATDGEVEDYPVSVGLLDFGDLPDTGAGSGTGNYSTVLADNGPRHPIVTGLFLGATEDGEADGQPNVAANGDGVDEDGVTLADLNLTAGAPATIRVNATNTTGSAAQLCAFVDFNGNGSFADAGEATSVPVPTGSNGVQFSLGFTVPTNAVTASYARFRLSTDTVACSPVGQATNGEVEDYPVGITLIDFGDLPDTGAGSGTGNYSTLLADNGARHPIVANLAMGAGVDAEANGQPSAGANADDANGTPDDEDGVNTADLALQRGVAPAVRVTATNGTGSAALLCGYLDYNADGDFADAGEAAQVIVPNGSTAAPFTLNFGTVPNTAAAASFARFRLSTDAACSPTGAAANGEVEDYPITTGAGVLSLGNLVWNDRNNNGVVDSGENGISAVTVVLYRDSDNNGTPDGAAIATTSTDGSGNYLFAALDPDTYLVEIAPPAGYRTSTGSGLPPYLPTGSYEPAPDPDNDVNNDDNGTTLGAVIRSAPVTLSVGGEPVNDGDADANSNLSVDFGLVGNFDLALRKSLTAGQPGPFAIGQDVSFDITVFNQGAIQATTIVVNDYIPAGFALSPNETNWTSVSPTLATRTIAGPLAPGASTVVTILLRIQTGAVSPLVNRAEIGSADDDGNAGTPPPLDVDSTPDGNPNNDAGGAAGSPSDDATGGNGTGTPGGTDPATDEDDADPAQITFGGGFDLALRKVVSAGQPGPFAPGQDISFDITVFNQGSVQATTIVVNDYIPAGFALSPSETNWTSVSPTLATRTIAGPLAPGASTVVTILLRIQTGAVSPLVNRAEIGSADDDGNTSTPPPTDIDSTPDGNPGNDAGGAAGTPSDDATGGNGTGTPGGTDPATDEDDADPAQITFGTGFDLALRKRVSAGQPGPFAVGQDVSFDIEVFNQGTVQATTIVINDYIPAGFELSPTELNWSPVNASLATRTISGPLLPGASTTVTITLRILPGAVSPLVNRAEIGSADDDGDSQTPPPLDIDSTPDGNPGNDAGGAAGSPSDDATGGNGTGTPGGTDPLTDEDDSDPAQIVIGPPGVASPLGVAKQAQVLSVTDNGGYGNGGTPNSAQLAYVILLRNYGTQPVASLQVVEDLVSTFGAGTVWSVVSVTAPTLTLNPAFDGRTSTTLLAGTDTLAVGATTTIRLVVNVQFTAGVTYNNQVTGSGVVGSTPVSDLSNDGIDPAPTGNPGLHSTPTGTRLGTQAVPALSPVSIGLLLLGLALLASRRTRQVRVRARS